MIDPSVRRDAVIEECADRVLAAFNHLWNERASEDGDNASLLAGMTELFNVVYNGLRALASPEKAGPCLSGIASNEPCQPDDTLRRCTICGFIVDTRYAAEAPNPERGPRK